jgi:hypothetical protein
MRRADVLGLMAAQLAQWVTERNLLVVTSRDDESDIVMKSVYLADALLREAERVSPEPSVCDHEWIDGVPWKCRKCGL